MRKKKKRQPRRSNEELVERIWQGDESCIEELLKQNEGFIHAVMTSMGIDDPHNKKEYMQAGRVGLLRSIPKYDPTRGTKFLTCAKAWIKKEMGNLRAQNIKFNREIPLARLERKSKKGRPEQEDLNEIEDTLIKHRDERKLENKVLRTECVHIIHECIGKMGPRERYFVIDRYGFYDHNPLGRAAIAAKYHIPTNEILRLEDRVHKYVMDSLEKGKVLAFSVDTLDPQNYKDQQRMAYESLFSEPADQYLTSLLDGFQEDWEYSMEADFQGLLKQ